LTLAAASAVGSGSGSGSSSASLSSARRRVRYRTFEQHGAAAACAPLGAGMARQRAVRNAEGLARHGCGSP
jgi:hypothetical protein